MPLQQLVEYFNDRFEHEHHSRVRTFILEDGKINENAMQVLSAFLVQIAV